MAELNNPVGLLVFGAIAIIIGISLITPIANDIETIKDSSVTVTNETLSFSTVTRTVINESVTMSNMADGSNGTFANDDLTAFTALRNTTALVITSFCNVTLSSGKIRCNSTGNNTAYADYTYINRRTETLTNNELLSFDAIRNSSSPSANMMGHCNVTLLSGDLVCNNTHTATGYADYKYEPDTYVHSGAARTLTNLTTLFFAIGVMTIGLVLVTKGFKDMF